MRKKYSILFVAILCIGLLISAGTYAFWTWNSNLNKNVVFNVASGFEQYIIYDEGDSSFIGNFQPSDNYCNALRNTISFRKTTDDVDFYATIYMDVKEIGYNISNSDSVYWIVTSGDSTGCTGNLSDALSYGTFKGMSNGSVIEMLNNIEVTTTEQKYTIWIWLDRSGDNISELSGETLNTNVWTQFDMYPSDGLDGGSVVISGDNEVGSILTANITNTTPDADSYTYQWYTHTENLTTGGILIDGATSNTLTVNNNYAGKYIYVVVTAIKDNSISKSLTDITDIRNNKYAFVPKLDAVMTVSVSSLNITYPNSGSFTYTYNGDGIVTCSSSDTSVSECSVNPSTKTVTVSSKKEGTANITLSASQGTTYDAISQIIPVTIQVQSYPIRYYSDNTIVPWKSETKMHGDNTYTLTSDVPVKRGYIFKEWNTSKDGTGTSYSPGSIYSANSSVSLYAVWELGVFSINEDFEDTTYDSNITSITNPTSSPFTTGVSGGSTSNYLWSVSDGKFRTNAGSVKSTNYGNVTSTASITSTIVIQPTKDTTLSFDYGLFLNESNSAYLSILLNDTQIIYVTSDTDTSYSTNLEANTKYTLEFIAHHSTEVVYGGVLKTTAYAFIDNLVVNESIIYTVSYDANGGAGAPASQTKAEGESLILSSTVPTRTGFNFISWNTSTSGIGTSYNPGDEYSADASVTLYAIWQEKGVITNDNIGEYIDLGNDIIGTGGSTSDDWRILYVENGNIYAILADFLPNSSNYASGAGLNLVTNKSYGVNSTVGRADLLTKLTTNSNWSGLTNGITGAMATGAPTEELILNSYRTDAGKEPTNNTFDSTIENYSLYVSQTGDYNGTHNYWLATEASGSTTDLRGIRYSGEIRQDSYNNEYMGLRPVVVLPSSVRFSKDGDVWVVNKGISVTNDDIGKYIDLGNDIIGTGGSTSDDWRILYVENGNIYAILADFLPNSSNYASDAGLNLVTNKSYGVNSTVNRADLLTKLTTNSNWSGLTNGITGATATGAPTEELILNSYRTEAGKEPTNNTFDSTIANYSLYVSRTGDYNGTHNYWLATEASGSTTDLRGIRYSGEIRQDSYNNEYMGLRPVVVLPSSVIVSKDGDVLAVNKDISITNNNINEDFEDTTYDSNITSITSPTISASTTGGLTGASSFDFLWSVTDGMLRTNSESFNGSIISQKTLNSGDITSTIVFTPTSNKTLSFKYGLVKNGSSSTSLVIKLNNTEVVSVTGDTDTTYTTNLTANTTYTLELIHSHTSSSMMSSVTTAYAFIDDLIVN